VVVAFGKYAGRLLAAVAASDRGYLEWMLTRPFLDDAHDLIRRVGRHLSRAPYPLSSSESGSSTGHVRPAPPGGPGRAAVRGGVHADPWQP
jgi:hypothetical protein